MEAAVAEFFSVAFVQPSHPITGRRAAQVAQERAEDASMALRILLFIGLNVAGIGILDFAQLAFR